MKNKVLIITLFILGLAAIAGWYFVFGKRTQSTRIESSNYKLYSKDVYEQALKDRKIVLLYFTANWCPICREQEPVNMQALEGLKSEAVGLRIHILDSETTKEGEELAKKYGVTYQHTFVIIGPLGNVATSYTGPLTAEDLKAKLLDAKKP